jgi:hypothetical protein
MLRKEGVWTVLVAVIVMVVACPEAGITDAGLNGAILYWLM